LAGLRTKAVTAQPCARAPSTTRWPAFRWRRRPKECGL
jgi:hypothetical protein